MKIVVTSVLVDDQDKALSFYRDLLDFEPKLDIPMGYVFVESAPEIGVEAPTSRYRLAIGATMPLLVK